MTDLLSLMSSYRKTASWAVWGAPHPSARFTRDSDLSLPVRDPELSLVLRSDVVLLGLNPGNAAHDRARDESADYINFHTGPKHNDHLIAEAFRETQYWGSYMTDLYAQIESRSALVKDVPTDIDALLTEIAALNGGEPVHIIAFGARTYQALAKHSKRLASAGLVRDITRIPHYSGSNNGQHKGSPAVYRRLVHAALGWLDEATDSPGTVVESPAGNDPPPSHDASDYLDGFVQLAGELYEEAGRCAEAELWRAAVLAIGGAVEAAIVGTATVLEPQLRKQGIWPTVQDPLRWQLGRATQLARDAGWLSASLPGSSDDLFEPLHGEVGDAVRFLVAVRNMVVHPGAYIRANVRPDFTDINHMRPTYDILHGIAGEVFGQLAAVLGYNPVDHPG